MPSILHKIMRLLAAALRGIICFILVLVGLSLILALALFVLWCLVYTLQTWNWANWVQSVPMVLLYIIVLAGAPVMALKFFQEEPWAQRALDWYHRRLDIFLGAVLTLLIPYGVLAFFIAVVGIAWALLLILVGQSTFSTIASWYLMGTLVTLAYTLFSQTAAQWILRRMARSRQNLPWLFKALQPTFLRVCAYAVLALAYFVANFENFAGQPLLHWGWWENFRQIIVEVLLTYVAIDGAFTAWRDHREAARKYSSGKMSAPKDETHPPTPSVDDGQSF